MKTKRVIFTAHLQQRGKLLLKTKKSLWSAAAKKQLEKLNWKLQSIFFKTLYKHLQKDGMDFQKS